LKVKSASVEEREFERQLFFNGLSSPGDSIGGQMIFSILPFF
jgi:hypothetical protein